jgi:hypothetical protein
VVKALSEMHVKEQDENAVGVVLFVCLFVVFVGGDCFCIVY